MLPAAPRDAAPYSLFCFKMKLQHLFSSSRQQLTATLMQPSTSAIESALVGASWFTVSSILTTYSTSAFLLHPRSSGKAKEASSSSSVLLNSVIGKTTSPLLLTLWRFGLSQAASTVTLALLYFFRDPGSRMPSAAARAAVSRLCKTLPVFFVPAVSLYAANLFNSYALATSGISLTYVTKCSIPIFTLLLSPLLIGRSGVANVSAARKLMLIPISLGIAMSCFVSTRFSLRGLAYALISCVAQVCLNVFSVSRLQRTSDYFDWRSTSQ